MDDVDPADFYTGIVVDVYGPLRGSVPDPRTYARFISRWGEPALELGCGDGDPMLTLRAEGPDVHGLDSSADMLAKLRSTATERGLDVTVHHATIEQMDLGTTFRSIFLAGPTFNLIVDDSTAHAALERIRDHLDPAGAALIPLFIPDPVPERHLHRTREHVDDRGRTLRVAATPPSSRSWSDGQPDQPRQPGGAGPTRRHRCHTPVRTLTSPTPSGNRQTTSQRKMVVADASFADHDNPDDVHHGRRTGRAGASPGRQRVGGST